MSPEVVLTVPDDVVRSAERIARQSRRSLEAVLAAWLDRAASELPVEELDDDALLTICDAQLSPEEQAELSTLLFENREGTLDETARVRLDELARAYDHRLLRKSQALREAVARGLREPLAA
jgi:hypothetical protein